MIYSVRPSHHANNGRDADFIYDDVYLLDYSVSYHDGSKNVSILLHPISSSSSSSLSIRKNGSDDVSDVKT